MTAQTNSNVPKIRFKGFEGEWDEEPILSRIKSIIDFRGRTPKKLGLDWSPSGYLALSALNVKDGYIDLNADAHYGDEELYTKWMKGNELHCNQVLFTTEASMGNVAQIPDTKKYILSQRTIAFVTDTARLSEDFLAVLLKSPNVFGELLVRSSGGTAKGVSQKSLSSIHVRVSDELAEQTKIGGYFRELDSLIGLHQRKHDKLVALKKAMLQKMFPQPGAATPEIRFKGFSGGWAENTLKTAAEITTGFPFKSSDFSESGTYLVITNGNIQNQLTFVDASVGNRISIQNSVGLNQFLLRVGDILVTMDGSVGRTAKVRETNQILAQRVGRLVAKLDSEFLYQVLNTGAFLEEMIAISHGGTIKHISLGEIGNYLFLAPSDFEEQQKIGAYFRTLDELISKYATQLQKLQQIKSACLEKMFV